MRSSLVRRLGLSAILPCAAVGALALSGLPSLAAAGAAPATKAVQIDAQEVAQVNFPQIHWDIDGGSAAYRQMLSELDELARSTANARRSGIVVNTRGNRVTVTILDNTRTNRFADIVISAPGEFSTAVHAVVRLSDLYVVRVYTVGSPHNHVLNLASGLPNESSTDVNFFVGREGYDALSRVANQALTSVNIGPGSLAGALGALANPNSTRANQARSLLTLIFSISEGARFRTLADRVANALDSGIATNYSYQQISLIRDWAGVSHVFVGRTNHTDDDASTSVAGATIADARQAAALLAIALNSGPNPNPKDEL
ncbi:ribosome-inactivating family protein [Streptomyces sp. NBC_00582]|uniref:ribosome-inactivating family protein n=1 Tax=Streptomyces sp. NBC_00582 TaxID=2975783 RepID=UPI002E810EFE|nr:ribosome-inactivating family protein [Streptomyces sp. NBC_00582]WUB58997.1 ribosome-inactivating family protein [Streptomyces sp. NBC_00582]WUB67730.1 ribosome-inactivating family protein [Streptomyces sp. NBC_00582]